MKKAKIAFWVTTIIIFLFEGVMSALTSHTELAREGVRALGYPLYFGTMLMVFKVVGSLVLILPKASPRVKEWAYAGFGIDFIAAFVSLWVVNGPVLMTFFPLVFFIILVISYRSYHALTASRIAQVA